jgi:hypothetical protein
LRSRFGELGEDTLGQSDRAAPPIVSAMILRSSLRSIVIGGFLKQLNLPTIRLGKFCICPSHGDPAGKSDSDSGILHFHHLKTLDGGSQFPGGRSQFLSGRCKKSTDLSIFDSPVLVLTNSVKGLFGNHFQ